MQRIYVSHTSETASTPRHKTHFALGEVFAEGDGTAGGAFSADCSVPALVMVLLWLLQQLRRRLVLSLTVFQQAVLMVTRLSVLQIEPDNERCRNPF